MVEMELGSGIAEIEVVNGIAGFDTSVFKYPNVIESIVIKPAQSRIRIRSVAGRVALSQKPRKM